VMCEVLHTDMTPHVTNKRAELARVAEKYKQHDMWFGIEQEYTFFDGVKPLGWPTNGFPAPQFGYYCGVGADEVFGRDLVEEHMGPPTANSADGLENRPPGRPETGRYRRSRTGWPDGAGRVGIRGRWRRRRRGTSRIAVPAPTWIRTSSRGSSPRPSAAASKA